MPAMVDLDVTEQRSIPDAGIAEPDTVEVLLGTLPG